MSVADLIEALRQMPQDAEVMIHDADTDWALPMHQDNPVRLGEDEFGNGKDGVVMLQSDGY
jgi:hypothetical protein